MTIDQIICRYAERALFEIFCREDINSCIISINRKWRKGCLLIPIKLQVKNVRKNAKSDTETMYAKSINMVSWWNDFYETDAASGLDRCAMDNIEEKAERYTRYLTQERKSKYRLIQLPEDREWLRAWALISAAIRTAQWRHEESRFIDGEARQRMKALILRREQNIALSKSWGHSRKHGEDAQTTLAPVFDTFRGGFEDALFPPCADDLPMLPAGMTHPLMAVIRQLKGGNDD